jgi:hypothetical protein
MRHRTLCKQQKGLLVGHNTRRGEENSREEWAPGVLIRAANAVGSDIDFNLPIATRVDDTRIYVRLAEIPKCTSQLSNLSKSTSELDIKTTKHSGFSNATSARPPKR